MSEKTTVTLPAIAMIGAGSMAGAILEGLLSPHVLRTGNIKVTNRTVEKAERFAEVAQVDAFALESSPDANRAVAAEADIVLVAVKPAMVTDLLDEIASVLRPGTIVVSVAAGITTATMEAHVPESVAVIRTMPNTPSKVGLGVTGLCVGKNATSEQAAVITSMFETVGEVITIDESLIDALGAISGSGPAYVYYFIEKFVEVATERGFTPEQAKIMVEGTFRGAVELLASSGEQPAELRRQVTSPKGSTERAIAHFDKSDLHGIFFEATSAAIARSEEMARGE